VYIACAVHICVCTTNFVVLTTSNLTEALTATLISRQLIILAFCCDLIAIILLWLPISHKWWLRISCHSNSGYCHSNCDNYVESWCKLISMDMSMCSYISKISWEVNSNWLPSKGGYVVTSIVTTKMMSVNFHGYESICVLISQFALCRLQRSVWW